jgi:hypothetical protein
MYLSRGKRTRRRMSQKIMAVHLVSMSFIISFLRYAILGSNWSRVNTLPRINHTHITAKKATKEHINNKVVWSRLDVRRTLDMCQRATKSKGMIEGDTYPSSSAWTFPSLNVAGVCTLLKRGLLCQQTKVFVRDGEYVVRIHQIINI